VSLAPNTVDTKANLTPTVCSAAYNTHVCILQDEEVESREMLDIVKMSKWYYLVMGAIGSCIEAFVFVGITYSYVIFGVQVCNYDNTMIQYCTLYGFV